MRWGLLKFVLLVLALAPQLSWAQWKTVSRLELLPASLEQIIVNLPTLSNANIEHVLFHHHSAILLKQSRIDPHLLSAKRMLMPAAFIRPPFYPIQVYPMPEGDILYASTSQSVTWFATDNPEAFAKASAQWLPLYPYWPIQKPLEVKQQQKLLAQSEKAFDAQNLQAASVDLEALYRGWPSPPEELLQLMGYFQMTQGHSVPALCAYGQGAPENPNVFSLPYSSLLYQMDQPDKAIRVLSEMLRQPFLLSEVQHQAEYMLGTLLEMNGHYDQAKTLLESALSGFPNNPFVLFNLAIAHEGLHQPKEALATYTQARPYAQGPLQEDIERQIHRLQSNPISKK